MSTWGVEFRVLVWTPLINTPSISFSPGRLGGVCFGLADLVCVEAFNTQEAPSEKVKHVLRLINVTDGSLSEVTRCQ